MISIGCNIKIDKSSNYEQAVQKMKALSENGITKVLITKAYDEDGNILGIEKLNEEVNCLEEIADKERILIDLYPGSCIEASYTGIDEYMSGVAGTINRGSYVFLSIGTELDGEVLECIHEFLIKDKIPVIAQPETNITLNEKPKLIKDLAEMGCYFQLNIKSLEGHYGKKAKKAAKYFMKKGLYDFVHIEEEKSLKKLSKAQKQKLYENSQKLLNNRYISAHRFAFVRKSIFSLFKSEARQKKIEEVSQG